MTVTFSEAVYNTSSGSGVLQPADFTFTLSGGSATLGSNTPSSITQSTDNRTFTLGINLSGTSDGTQELTVTPTENSIFDAAGNAASTTQSNNVVTLKDSAAPTIESTSLVDNSSMTVTFSEAVYSTDSGSGNLETADFTFSLSEGSAKLGSNTPSSITQSTDNRTFTLGINLSGTSDGTQELTVTPTEDSIFDAAGNAASTSQTNNVVTLNDSKRPTISITSQTVGNGDYTNQDSVQLTFRCSEELSDFSTDKISLEEGDETYGTQNLGTIESTKDGNDTLYETTLTVQDIATYTVSVEEGACKDAAGNTNIASNEFKFNFDSSKPIMTISSQTISNGGSTNNSKISLTFVSTEETSDFTANAITVRGGSSELSNFRGSGREYTATLTVSEKGNYEVSVAKDKFTDSAGNKNNRSNIFSFTYNPFQPSTTGLIVAYILLALTLGGGICAGIFIKNKPVYACRPKSQLSPQIGDMV